MAMKFVQTFRVRGRGHFPLDMLRYDHCFPRHETESALLTGFAGEFREVELMRYVELAADKPTTARWQSFTWEVMESSIRTERLR